MKILCIDDDKLALASLKILLDVHEVITFTSPFEAIKYYQKNKVDIVLLDIRMQELNGIETAKKIREINPDAKIILLSTFIETAVLKEIIQLKLNGYLLKINPESIIESLDIVNSDQVVFHNTVLSSLSFSEVTNTTPQLNEVENKILRLVAKGYNNQEIAEQLNYSTGTIRNYISNILEQLDLRDRTQLVVYYYTGNKY